MKRWLLLAAVLCCGCLTYPDVPTPPPGPTPTPPQPPAPVSQAVVDAFEGDSDLAAAVAPLAELFAEAIERDDGVIKTTADIRDAWRFAGRKTIDPEARGLHKNLAPAIEAEIIKAIGKQARHITPELRGTAADAFRLIAASARSV